MSTTIGSTLLTLLEDDALLSFGTPLVGFFTSVAAANGDPIKEGAAWVALQGALIGAAPSALGGLESQLATIIATRIQALVTKAAAPVTVT
jgi:hypothetical protein